MIKKLLVGVMVTAFCLTLYAQDNRLCLASMEGDLDKVSGLLAEGVDVNATMVGGFSPLMIATKYGKTQVMTALLRSNADINMTDRRGNTALMIAVLEDNLQAVRVLLAADARVETKNDNNLDVIELARIMKREAILKLLEAHQARKGS